MLILSVCGTLVRRFMLAAHDLGMTRGDWAFLDVEIFQVSFPFPLYRHCPKFFPFLEPCSND